MTAFAQDIVVAVWEYVVSLVYLAWENPWWCFFIFRYLRPAVNAYAFAMNRPIPLPETPRLSSQDVTVVIPSLEGGGSDLWDTICSILQTEPFEIILVTIDENLERATRMIKAMTTTKVRVLSVSQPNKRRQMVRAIPEISTAVTIFADDDVTWPPTLLPWMLAPLEQEEYGGVGTNQRLRRAEDPTFGERIWGFLGAAYLERRNFDCGSCSYMDGGLPCLSGRTVAYRTKILSDDAFTYGFTHEAWGWRRDYQLNADDDNFITRWLVSHGQKIAYQYHKQAEVLTTLESNAKFLKQCLRWSRSNWRSNLTSMFVERHVLTQQPWSTYSVFQTTITHWALAWDFLLFYFCPQNTFALTFFIVVWACSKVVKLCGHFIRYPVDIFLLPVSILFGYFHSLIKLYAGLTLHVTAWGSREGADTDDGYRMRPLTQTERSQATELRAQEVFTQ